MSLGKPETLDYVFTDLPICSAEGCHDTTTYENCKTSAASVLSPSYSKTSDHDCCCSSNLGLHHRATLPFLAEAASTSLSFSAAADNSKISQAYPSFPSTTFAPLVRGSVESTYNSNSVSRFQCVSDHFGVAVVISLR
jgi:hypothetical protein